ncbi:hypothetical protein MHF_1433 [Mycoplasma haemofelis Ohio2]|uniref:Uncharacterized protein n=1 Tax=Mycoplasma haemofelis (strain Ohio2) TaxID=859194 RepID=F6FGM9_MYCHI|nr:hypothetical protein MHF_1433 [Mycoplasma haemofelis Ohio2]
MPIQSKTLFPVAIVGSFAAWTAIKAARPFTIERYLKVTGRPMLSQGDSSSWDIQKARYSESNNQDLIRLGEGEISPKNIGKDPSNLKFWCEANSKRKFLGKDDWLFKLVATWCTSPISFTDQLENLGSEILDFEYDYYSNKDQKYWDSVIEDYWKKSKEGDWIQRVDVYMGKPFENGVLKKSEATVLYLKKWCEFNKEQPYKHELDPKFIRYKKWCTKA